MQALYTNGRLHYGSDETTVLRVCVAAKGLRSRIAADTLFP
jgi:hypothetical protein